MMTRRKLENGSAEVSESKQPAGGDDSSFVWPYGLSLVLDFSSIISMVLGGCCANVLAYEQLLLLNPRIGSAMTFAQMLFITLQSLPSFLTFTPYPQLKPRQVPLERWGIQVFLMTTGSLMNNWAYAYNVPFTILIVFRSGGLAISMLFGFLFLKRRYALLQIASVAVVTIGVVYATLSRPSMSTTSADPDITRYATGIGMLTISLLATGILGILQEQTYKTFGPCWQEGVFYTHFLSLPLFAFFVPDIKQGLISLTTSTRWTPPWIAWVILGINLVSQLICVSGVNKLTARTSNVSTNLVLTLRKALSLCLTVYWSGSVWDAKLGIGAGMVFVGSLLFTIGAQTKKI